MLAPQGHQMRGQRHHPCFSRRAVLQPALVVVPAGVGPPFARLGKRAVHDQPPPARSGQPAVRQRRRDRLLRTQTRVVHAGEEPHQPTATSPPIATHVGDGAQQLPCPVRVGHHPRLHRDGRLGHPPPDVLQWMDCPVRPAPRRSGGHVPAPCARAASSPPPPHPHRACGAVTPAHHAPGPDRAGRPGAGMPSPPAARPAGPPPAAPAAQARGRRRPSAAGHGARAARSAGRARPSTSPG